MIPKVRPIAALFAAYAIAAQAGMPEALDAIKRNDFNTATIELRPLAKQGSTEAQVLLARVLNSGQGDPQSKTEAFSLFQMAANAGNEDAMLILAVLYEKGETAPKNQQESIKWLRVLAERSNSKSYFLLASKYADGLGVPQSVVISQALYITSGLLSKEQLRADGGFGAMTIDAILKLAEDLRKPNNFLATLDRATSKAVLFNEKHPNLPNAVKARIVDAEAGDVASIVKIGSLYLYGEQQVARDPKLAAYWFQRAASLGDPIGRDYMANLYLEGVGVDKDYKKAFELFSGLGAQGKLGVEGKLGVMYKDGLGVPQDFVKAHYWLRKSVGAVGENLFALAQMYEEGSGVEKNTVIALSLARLSASKHPDEFKLGMPRADNPAVAFVQVLKLKLSPYEIAVASKLASQLLSASVGNHNQLELLDLAATKRGDVYAISPVEVAEHFVHNYDDENFPLALKLLEPLIEQNNSQAQYVLGSMLEDGKGVPVDAQKANALFELAEMQGNVDALTRKGGRYFRGEGVAQDFSKAFESYEKAANRGGAFAQGKVAAMLADGMGVNRDTRLAITWYEKALAIPDNYWKSDAYKGLAKIYIGERSFLKAAQYFKKAAAMSDKDAQLALAQLYYEGQGVPRNMKLAFVLSKVAQRDGNHKAKAVALSAIAKQNLSVDEATAIEQLVVDLSNLDRYSGSIQKDADMFLEMLEAAETSNKGYATK
ncbi:tetratricopeptide repeat protein [Herbaspirillum sp. RV1423]|uniref:tetratricopeptide repeat protein n=1 Tax=Herbaspirillum sp. RV1423 TaxID=1443993 RepID=UPI0004B340CD|nr:tetratricopeptide repeat protein [Herbaspirillum sp. RV1423]